MLAAGAYADSDWLKGSTDEKLKSLAELQPGLGTVMIEYATRYTHMYYAAKGGNWSLADYMLKEQRNPGGRGNHQACEVGVFEGFRECLP